MFKNILVVDDDTISNYIFEKTLSKAYESANIRFALNGEAGIELVKESTPDLILLDINMPICNGFQFMEKFNDLNLDKNKITIIVISSSDLTEDKNKMYDYGIDRFISKPFDNIKINLLTTLQKGDDSPIQ